MAVAQRLAHFQHPAGIERIHRCLVIAKGFSQLFALALHETHAYPAGRSVAVPFQVALDLLTADLMHLVLLVFITCYDRISDVIKAVDIFKGHTRAGGIVFTPKANGAAIGVITGGGNRGGGDESYMLLA